MWSSPIQILQQIIDSDGYGVSSKLETIDESFTEVRFTVQMGCKTPLVLFGYFVHNYLDSFLIPFNSEESDLLFIEDTIPLLDGGEKLYDIFNLPRREHD